MVDYTNEGHRKDETPTQLRLGDFFTHTRSGIVFVCTSITNYVESGKIRSRVELEVLENG